MRVGAAVPELDRSGTGDVDGDQLGGISVSKFVDAIIGVVLAERALDREHVAGTDGLDRHAARRIGPLEEL